jgi:hypothetical protein
MIFLGRSTVSTATFQVSLLVGGYSLREVHTVMLLARVRPEMCPHCNIVLEDGPAILAEDSDMSSVNVFPSRK